MSQITLARTDTEIADCFSVMAQLRPHLSADRFVDQVRRQMTDGYHLVRLDADGVVRAVAGYRIYENLVRERHMYVDDLVTDEQARSAGHGAALMRWLIEQARTEGCTHLELDSGVQRAGAHRFYFRHGMSISSYHFTLPLKD